MPVLGCRWWGVLGRAHEGSVGFAGEGLLWEHPALPLSPGFSRTVGTGPVWTGWRQEQGHIWPDSRSFGITSIISVRPLL